MEREWSFGPRVTKAGTAFRLWAPRAAAVDLVLPESGRRLPMSPGEDGWFMLEVQGLADGALYAFSLDGKPPIPDPASPCQPRGVEGPSKVIDHAGFAWEASGWRGRPSPETVIYELHVGTFTPEGSYRAAIGKLDLLVDLGVTAIELMPVHDFPGRWGWSYDGVCLFAPASRYGTPADLAALVDAAHERGLMVFLDVVYNHFGPQGNRMVEAMPLLSERHATEFGTPPDLDGENAGPVRRFLIENALHWLIRYRFDGLRFDAAHELHDDSEPHFLTELAGSIKRALPDREVHLILENSRNETVWLARDGHGHPRAYTALWSDDIHHALHVALSGEATAYYEAFTDPVRQAARALAEGLCFQETAPDGSRSPRNGPSTHLPPTAFIAYVQNHDQPGNRPGGVRVGQQLGAGIAKVMATVVLLSPAIPLIFMGEEWAATSPFFYFSDLDGAIREAIRHSRAELLARWGQDEPPPTPDPFDPAAFTRSRLDWAEREHPDHRGFLDLYRDLLHIRRTHLVPRLYGMGGHAGRHERTGERSLRVEWRLADGALWRLDLDLDPQGVSLPEPSPAVLWRTACERHGGTTGPWAEVSLIA